MQMSRDSSELRMLQSTSDSFCLADDQVKVFLPKLLQSQLVASLAFEHFDLSAIHLFFFARQQKPLAFVLHSTKPHFARVQTKLRQMHR